MKSKQVLALVCAMAGATQVFAQTTINFDGSTVPLNTDLGSFYPGVTFGEGAQVQGQTTPEFPANSLPNILTDADPANPSITFKFTTPVASFSFLYASLSGFSGTVFGTDGTTVLGTFTGSANAVSPGSLVNTTLLVAGQTDATANIGSVELDDNFPLAGGIGLDDLTFNTNVVATPDATSTMALLGVAATGLLAFRRKITA